MAEEGDVVPYSTGKWAYDVFLNFRGADTRDGFTRNLYKSLREREIRTFFDDDELSRGKQIKSSLFKAIEESMIAIVVFSPNYAFSSYCLDELVHILDCCQGNDRLVLPVFVDVDPSHVRHQLGAYGEAITKHEQGHHVEQEKLQRWRQALADAADLSGWHIQQGSKSEFTFVRKIIGEVSRRINRTHLHNIGNHLVGMESPVCEVIELLELESEQKTIMLGILGFGGIGKTTLAQAVYSSISGRFEAICFLADVYRRSCDLGIVRLQEALLSDLVDEKNIKFTDANEIIPTIKHRLRRKKVLVILDDVYEMVELESLAGDCDWFGSGSRVIITTRNRYTKHDVQIQYELNPLSEVEAFELFCRKAFENKDTVPIGYMELAIQVVRYCCGIPLVLELLGSDLFGKPDDEWVSLLQMYKSYDAEDIAGLVMINYEFLDDNVKIIFLDIACCFNGYKVDYLSDLLLNGRGFSPKYALQVLISKSYIKIDDGGVVRMHDLIEDMGRGISRQSGTGPGKHSRLWLYKDVLKVLKNNKVEIMKIDLPKHEEVLWDGNGFKNMQNLKILEINNVCFSEVPKIFPNNLRVLNWKGYFREANYKQTSSDEQTSGDEQTSRHSNEQTSSRCYKQASGRCNIL